MSSRVSAPLKFVEAFYTLLLLRTTDQLTAHWFDYYFFVSLSCSVSSQHKWNLEELMEEIWDRTNMLRIYPKVRTIPPVVVGCLSSTCSSNFPSFWSYSQKGKFQTMMNRSYYERKILQLKNFAIDYTKDCWPSFHMRGFVRKKS